MAKAQFHNQGNVHDITIECGGGGRRGCRCGDYYCHQRQEHFTRSSQVNFLCYVG